MANTASKSTASKSTAKNTAPNAQAAKGNADDGLPDFANWTPLQIGFAPYWHPEPNKKFFGEIIAKDERDAEFIRYQIRNLKPVEQCRRGPNNNDTSKGAIGEAVEVPKGDTFSVSVYYSLADEFDFHLYIAKKTGKHVPVLIEALKTVRTTSGNDCWQWRALVAPETKQMLDGHRDEFRRLQTGEDEGERPALES